MNDSEIKVHDWLLKQGIKEEDIAYNQNGSPDFIVSNNGEEIGYEVKLIKFNSIHLHGRQHENIKKRGIKSYIVVIKKEDKEPRKIIDYSKIRDIQTQTLGGYKIYIANLNKSQIAVDIELLDKWKHSINHTEKLSDRLEEAFIDNINKHTKNKMLKGMGERNEQIS